MVTTPAWTSLASKSSGDTITASDWAAAFENVRWLNYPPAAIVRRYASQTVSTATWTAVSFNEADYYDPWGFHSPTTNPSRITVPSGCAGVYSMTATFDWQGGAPGTLASCRFVLNGSTVIGENGVSNNATTGCASTHWSLAAGDYIEMQVYQNSGASRTLFGGSAYATVCSVAWLGATS